MKKCAKCDKTVYPTEELKCLDKVWHKSCFKCQVCNMTLNMKNYKGYDKLPYCNAHYPQTKHTVVADTPDMKRVQENTRIQSNVAYHSDFEKSRGACHQIPDTLDMQRNLQNTKNASLIEYHSDFEKQRGQITTISNPLEMATHLKNTENFSLIKYHADFEKAKGKYQAVTDDPVTLRAKQNMATISNIEYHQVRQQRESQEMKRPAERVEAGQVRVRRDPGKIADYDPGQTSQAGGGTPYSSRSSASMVYDSRAGRAPQPVSHQPPPQQSYQPPPPKQTYQPLPQQSYQPPPQQQYQPPSPQPQPPTPKGHGKKGMVCQAMYDYKAADDDEVGFAEGDTIIFCQPIDQGWMEGTVERTGMRGMLPSNYVERV